MDLDCINSQDQNLEIKKKNQKVKRNEYLYKSKCITFLFFWTLS